jgi:hypothetical protein
MPVLVHDSANHGREQRAVRKRPVGDGEAGVVAGDKGASDDEEKCATRGENGETVKIAIPCFSQNPIVLAYEIRKYEQLVYDSEGKSAQAKGCEAASQLEIRI